MVGLSGGCLWWLNDGEGKTVPIGLSAIDNRCRRRRRRCIDSRKIIIVCGTINGNYYYLCDDDNGVAAAADTAYT